MGQKEFGKKNSLEGLKEEKNAGSRFGGGLETFGA